MARFQTTPSSDPRFPDEETRKIAEDLEKAGHAPLDGEPVPHNEDDEEEVDEEAEEGKDTPTPKPKPKPKVPKKGEEPDDEDPADAPEGDEDEDEPAKPRRQVLIPIARVKQNEKKLRDEYDAKLSDLTKQVETLQQQRNNGADDVELKAKQEAQVAKLTELATTIADAHDADPALIKQILETAATLNQAKVEFPRELVDSIKSIQASNKKREDQEAEQAETEDILNGYDDEFGKTFSASSDEGKTIIAEIRTSGLTLEQFKERLQDLVLGEDGEKYAKLSLEEVFQLKKSVLLPKKAKSAEGARGRTATGTSDSGENDTLPSADEIRDMSMEEFEKMSNNLAKHSKPRIMRRGRPV